MPRMFDPCHSQPTFYLSPCPFIRDIIELMSNYATSVPPPAITGTTSLYFCPALSSPPASRRRDLAFTLAYGACSSVLVNESAGEANPDARQRLVMTLCPSLLDKSVLSDSESDERRRARFESRPRPARLQNASDAQFTVPSPAFWSLNSSVREVFQAFPVVPS